MSCRLEACDRRSRVVGRASVLLGMASLAGAICLIIYGEARPLRRTFFGSVADFLPDIAKHPGWSRELRPIGETPEIQKKVDEQLNYDDAVFAIYQKGELRVSVYIAYWTPGKVSERLIAGHTPDICWVGAGWKCAERRVNPSLGLTDGMSIPAARERRMEWGGAPPSGPVSEWILFWHLRDGELRDAGAESLPPWYAMAQDIWDRKLEQRSEQFFIRLSSNQPIDRWWNEKIVEDLVRRMPFVRRLAGR